MEQSKRMELYGFPVNLIQTDDKDGILRSFAEDVKSREDEDDPFMVTDLGDILDKVDNWTKILPRVEPFYAVKCNGDPVVVNILADLGLGFDCASQKEIETILSLGVRPERIVYANPYKQASYVKYAAEKQVYLTVVDSVEELEKIKKVSSRFRLLVRIKPVDGSECVIRLDKKFGCSPTESSDIIAKAKELNLDLVGVSFHVGSACLNPRAYVDSIVRAKHVFDEALQFGYKLSVLDIGGGFSGDKDSSVHKKFCKTINEALDKYFPADSGVRIIAEPGRYFVASAVSLVVNVIGKFVQDCEKCGVASDQNNKTTSHTSYHVNDGLFGACNLLFYEKIKLKMHPLLEKRSSTLSLGTVWGHSVLDADCIERRILLPDVDVGEWLVVELDMGAYTSAISTRFSGMPLPHIYYVVHSKYLPELKKLTGGMEHINMLKTNI